MSELERVAYIVNGGYGSPMGERARAFQARLAQAFEIQIAYRTGNKIVAALNFTRFLRELKPALVYVFDIGYSGVIAAANYCRSAPCRLVIDTGDAIHALAVSVGERSRAGIYLTDKLERFALRRADAIVVRGTRHLEYLAPPPKKVFVLQDGVDTEQFYPTDATALRGELGVQDCLTIGLVGSSQWSEKLQMCYGWELVETLHLLKEKNICGVMVGDGSGIEILRRRAEEYGIADKVKFVGRINADKLNEYLNAMDICLSTQSNDVVGQVRTTGKLPLYLAMGRYILATDVGEAALVLPPEMRLPYSGVKDGNYPQRLKEAIQNLMRQPEKLHEVRAQQRALAYTHFDYDRLATRKSALLHDVLGAAR